jgi:hypothetical protein
MDEHGFKALTEESWLTPDPTTLLFGRFTEDGHQPVTGEEWLKIMPISITQYERAHSGQKAIYKCRPEKAAEKETDNTLHIGSFRKDMIYMYLQWKQPLNSKVSNIMNR